MEDDRISNGPGPMDISGAANGPDLWPVRLVVPIAFLPENFLDP